MGLPHRDWISMNRTERSVRKRSSGIDFISRQGEASTDRMEFSAF